MFAKNEFDLGSFTSLEHDIDTENARPVKQIMRRTPACFAGEEEAHLKKMLDAGVIEESDQGRAGLRQWRQWRKICENGSNNKILAKVICDNLFQPKMHKTGFAVGQFISRVKPRWLAKASWLQKINIPRSL